MFSKKISRRNFLKASAITTAMAAVGLPAFAEQPEDENCIKTGWTSPAPPAAPWTRACC